MTDELRKAAEAATPGPWQQHLVDDTTVTSTTLDVCCTFPDGGRNDDVDFAAPVEQHEANAAYIAAANPKAILELLDRIAALEAENARLREALTDLTEFVVSKFMAHDEPCDAHETGRLCPACESDGCIRAKLEAARLTTGEEG